MVCMGSIPACAGEPTTAAAAPTRAGVDPRVCGGAFSAKPRSRAIKGRSPRVRGSRGDVDRRRQVRRSIPACAGEPATGSGGAAHGGVDPRVCGGAIGRRVWPRAWAGRSPRVRGSLERIDVPLREVGSIPACAGEPNRARDAPARARVDPRVCGGAPARASSVAAFCGRSPRVRGSPGGRVLGEGAGGSIPACAGEPDRAWRGRAPLRVDPRVCGGARWASCRTRTSSGRSPRVRGSPAVMRMVMSVSGSIPACAGEPSASNGRTSRSRVDPRVCGGAHAFTSRSVLYRGRSPRVRGSRRRVTRWIATCGSIPACAGEPIRTSAAAAKKRVDPRVCGGAATAQTFDLPQKGRSPRVRGSHLQLRRRRRLAGSIPACAGEPGGRPSRRTRGAVDPRVCGGAPITPAKDRRPLGRSPRVRGSLDSARRARPCPGSIPACAGEPVVQHPRRWRRKVDPRVCGGARFYPGDKITCTGRSPRVRGSPRGTIPELVEIRSIPACAGEPTPPPLQHRFAWVDPRVCGGAVAMSVVALSLYGRSPRVRGSQDIFVLEKLL